MSRNSHKVHGPNSLRRRQAIHEAFRWSIRYPGPNPKVQCIRDYRRGQWQKKVADAMEQFEVAGISQTHDEMVRRIEEETAVNEARMEMALGNVDQQKVQIEEEAEKLRATDLVKQFKVEMGLLAPEPSASTAQKTIGGKEAQKTS